MKSMKKLFWMLLALPIFVACSNVEDPDDGGSTNQNDGTKTKPYSVTEVIAGKKGSSVFVKGYIVGAIMTEGTGDTYKETIQMAAPFGGDTNVLLAEKADETNRDKCIAVQLPSGVIRQKLNLKDNEANYRKQVTVKGSLVSYFKTPGVKDTDPVDFVFEGYVPELPSFGDVSICDDTATPKATYSYAFDDVVKDVDFANSEWKRFVVMGSRSFRGAEFSGNKYIQMTAHGATAGSRHQAWAVSPALDLSAASKKEVSFDLAQGYTKEDTKFEVYVLQCVDGKTVKTKLTLPNVPASSETSYSSFVTNKIDLSAFSGKIYIGFFYDGLGGASLSTTWQIDNFYFSAKPATTVVFASGASQKVNVATALDFTVRVTANNTETATTIAQTGCPSWVTFTDNGDGTAKLSGTAPAAAESSTITFTATNNGVTATQVFTLTVAETVAPTGNMILNGGFEAWAEGKVTNWEIASIAGFTGVQNLTIFNEGVSSVKLVHSGTKDAGKITPSRVFLAAGDYTWSFKYYTALGEKASLRIWAMSYDTETSTGQSAVPALVELKKILQVSTDLPLFAGVWTTKSIDFTVPTGGAYFEFELRCYAGTQGIYLDDVKVESR